MGVTVSHQYIYIYIYIVSSKKCISQWGKNCKWGMKFYRESTTSGRAHRDQSKAGFGCLHQWGGDTTNISDHFLSFWTSLVFHGFPWWFRGKEPICQAEDTCSIPGSGRSPGEGNGNPLQYTCLKNPMDGGAWQVTIHGIVKEIRLSN